VKGQDVDAVLLPVSHGFAALLARKSEKCQKYNFKVLKIKFKKLFFRSVHFIATSVGLNI
jgi:hypothetical protein